ncbi:hypothetical protein HanLR1_Chr11g0408991 [Helianthus annuus]|nr:hypothetical protein HanLR1_Chr11g0408991 [Helianthus annuus]
MYPKPLLDLSVACGFAHSLVVVDRTNAGDQLDLLEIYDGEGVEEPRAELSPAKQTKKMSCCCKNIQQEEEIQRSF